MTIPTDEGLMELLIEARKAWPLDNLARELAFARRAIAEAGKDAEPDPDGWIKWEGGGQCPVDLHVKVEVKTRFGALVVMQAGALFWGEYGPSTIAAFRLASPSPKNWRDQILTAGEIFDALMYGCAVNAAIGVQREAERKVEG